MFSIPSILPFAGGGIGEAGLAPTTARLDSSCPEGITQYPGSGGKGKKFLGDCFPLGLRI